MVTYGFYNSINHDRVYDATQMSEIFDGVIRDGVYEYVGSHFAVSVSDLSGFQVRVGTGRAWFNHTWTKNDAPLILTLPAPPTLDNYYRSDAIVIDINADVNVRENKITYVKGTEVADNPSPPRPVLANGVHKQVALAYITRVGAETSISQANIQYVVGTEACPYVFSPVQAIDLTAHVAQWQAAWEAWFASSKDHFDGTVEAAEALIAEQTSSVSQHANTAKSNINEYVSEFRVWIASQKSQFNGWMDNSENEFYVWFRNLQYVLDSDVAGHLQNEIDALGSGITTIEHGGTGNADGYIRTGYIASTAPLGSYATAEGMNTIALGEASHAEGGGNYTVQHQDNHFESENLIHFSSGDDDIDGSIEDVEGGTTVSVQPSAVQLFNYEIGGDMDDIITSFHVGVIIKNETTGDILKVKTGSIGSACVNNDDYVGYGGYYKSTYQSVNNRYADYGVLPGDYSYLTNEPYFYINGIKYVNVFDRMDFYIDLPWSGDMSLDANNNTVFQTRNITGEAITRYTESFNAKAAIVVDVVTNELVGTAEYDDYVYHVLDIPQSYRYDFKINNFSINSDYSYNITYYNNNVQHHPYRIYFSNKTSSEMIDWEQAKNDFYMINSISFRIEKDKKSVRIGRDHQMHTGGGHPGTVYSLSFYYSATFNGNDDRPLTWIPAGDYIHINGDGTKAVGDYCHAEGYKTVADGNASHTEGSMTSAGNDFYHTYGDHAEGVHTEAYSTVSNVVGTGGAHAEGHTTQAIGGGAHAEGYNTKALAPASHAGGIGAIASFVGQFVHGTFGFGGYLEVVENQDKNYTLSNGAKVFNGGLFLMRNNTDQVKTLKIQLFDGVNGILDRSRALWLMIVRDVPDETNPLVSNSYIGMFFVKYDIYSRISDNLPSWITVKEEGTPIAFEFGTPISVEDDLLPLKVKASHTTGMYLCFEVQFIRIM